MKTSNRITFNNYMGHFHLLMSLDDNSRKILNDNAARMCPARCRNELALFRPVPLYFYFLVSRPGTGYVPHLAELCDADIFLFSLYTTTSKSSRTTFKNVLQSSLLCIERGIKRGLSIKYNIGFLVKSKKLNPFFA